jgi:hypothetical protein
MGDLASNISEPILFVIGLFMIVWAILLFLLPFFVYGAWQRAKECSQKLDALVAIQRAAHGEKPAQSDGWS